MVHKRVPLVYEEALMKVGLPQNARVVLLSEHGKPTELVLGLDTVDR